MRTERIDNRSMMSRIKGGVEMIIFKFSVFSVH